MFDSLLNSKFYNKSKHAIKCIRTRLDPIRKKKQAMLRFLKKDVADLLTNGLDDHAFARMEGLIVEINQTYCYDMIEQFCDYILKQLQSLQKQRDCPREALEAVSTVIFAAARFPDLPELCDLRQIFTERYESYVVEFVSSKFVEKLQNKSFSNEEKLQAMHNVAEEFSIKFDAKALQRKLSASAEAKHDLPKKDSFRKEEPPLTMLNGHKEETSYERRTKHTPIGNVQKQEVQVGPKDIHIVPDRNGQLHERNRKKYCSDKPENMESSNNLVPALETKISNSHKEIKKDDRKGSHSHSRRAAMDRQELDLTGHEEDIGLLKSPKGKLHKVAPPYTKSMENRNQDVQNENGGGFGHGRLRTSGLDYKDSSAKKVGLDTFGSEKQGIFSANTSNGESVDRVPSFPKLKGTKGEKPIEENGYDRSYRVADSSPQDMQPARPMNNERRINTDPPYVKPNLNIQPDIEANSVKEGLLDDERLVPISGRRKYAKPAIVDAADKAIDDQKYASRTAGGCRRYTSTRSTAVYDDDYSRKGGYVQLQVDNALDEDVDNLKLPQRIPSGRRRHSSRRNGSYDDDYNAKVDHRQAGDEEDTAIDFGKLLPRTPSGSRRHRSRNAETYEGNRDEERTMDKLLMHYSRKGLDNALAKSRTRTADPPERAISLPTESIKPDEELKFPGRSTSMQPKNGGRVHPRMPDYDELATLISALRKE